MAPGEQVNVSLECGWWVSGEVVRVNAKTVRVRLNRDLYGNGTREGRFTRERVRSVQDGAFPPSRLAGRAWTEVGR